MDLDQAFVKVYGPATGARVVLEQRRALIQRARTTMEELRRELVAQFPAIDSVGADLDLLFDGNMRRLNWALKRIDGLLGTVAGADGASE